MILEALAEEEACLLAILTDPSGSELAEFLYTDDQSPDGRYRLWDFQWGYYHCDETYQADACGRGVGKSVSAILRACAWPFNHPGQEMLVTAPELSHLSLVTDKVEANVLKYRLLREMLKDGGRNAKANGIRKSPHWQVTYQNNARILSRLPGRSGTGVKGPHPLAIELDELQDFPRRGFTELTETIKISEPGAIWRCHGVSNGIGDIHHDVTSNRIKDMPFYIHRYIASHRPTWNDDERKAKIAMYGGSEESPDYVRNIFGEPGSANSPVFVLARLMACVQMNQTAWATEYNEQIYYRQLISGAELSDLKRIDENASIVDFLQIPGSHLDEQYTSYWGGMDVGFTNDPSEILIFGDVAQKGGKPDVSRLLTRISMKHIEAPEQGDMVRFLIRHYGRRFRFFGMDKSGNGLPVTQHLQRDPVVGKKVKGYNFTEKRAVAMEDRDLEPGESMEDLAIKKYVVEHATDLLRTWVDARAIELPYDDDLLGEWQAQGLGKSASEAQVRRYSSKADHTLDAGRMFALAKGLELIEAIMEEDNRQVPVIDVFF